MLISIIIPIYNEEKKIRLAINSCLAQEKVDMNQVEIIVADGNSIDDSLGIIKSMMTKQSIKLISNEHRYMPHGFNKALTITSGKYIMVMSGHSILEKDYLFNSLKAIRKYDAQCVSGVMDTIQDNHLGEIISIAQSTPFGVGNTNFRTKIKSGRYVDTGVFGLYKAKIFLEIGGMDEELIKNQDDEFNFRMIQNGGKIWLDPSIKSKYFSRNTSTKLFKQYFLYGFYKVRVFQKRRGISSIRQIIPAIFVLSLLISILLKILINNTIFLILIFGFYTVVNLMFSISAIINRHKNIFSIPTLQLAYLILHFSYGIGFVIGLMYFFRSWSSIETIDSNFNKESFAKNKR